MPAKTERNNAIAADIVAGLFPDEITQKHGISNTVLHTVAWRRGLRVKSRYRERGKALREAIRVGSPHRSRSSSRTSIDTRPRSLEHLKVR